VLNVSLQLSFDWNITGMKFIPFINFLQLYFVQFNNRNKWSIVRNLSKKRKTSSLLLNSRKIFKPILELQRSV